jgi:hypothetical protein
MLLDAFEAIRGLVGDPPFTPITEKDTAEKKSDEVFFIS